MIRRNFIKQSTILSGVFLLDSIPFSVSGASVTQLSVGIIGCGDRGNGILDMMKQMPELFKIEALCDVLDFRIEEAKKISADPNIKVYKNYHALLENKSIDLVIIASPLHLHFEMASAALDAGKHILLEKTMTYSISQAIQLIAKTKQHPELVLQVGHQFRYLPMCFKIKEMIEKGYLGDVTQIDCSWDRNKNWRRAVPEGYADKQINWRMYKEYSGGLVAELLSHQFDFINWAFNTHPDEIFATGGIDHYTDGRETYDNVQVLMRYKKAGMIGNFGATCGNARDGYLFKIKGTKGTVEMLMDDALYFPEDETKKELQTVDGVTGATKIEWTKDGGVKVMNEPMKDGTWYALMDLYKCITEKKQPTSNVFTGATTAVCVHLANQAMYGHKIEYWKSSYDFL